MSANEKQNLEEFTRKLKSQLEQSNVKVAEDVLSQALDNAWKSMEAANDCESCQNGANW